MRHRIRPALATLAMSGAALVLVGAAGCAVETDPSPSSPPTGVGVDYQLGGAYEPADGVGIVVRDRTASPDPTRYSICYVNAFQTQPGELAHWPDDLLLHAPSDGLVYDPDWPDEALLDTRRADGIAEIVIPWIRGCADDGYDAVEFDNLDSYTRSGDMLSLNDNLALARLLVDAAHRLGLAVGQKNAAEDAAELRAQAGFDFAVTEECGAYDECSAYTAVYGDHVVAIEYTDALPQPFADLCDHPDQPRTTVLRDRDLVTPEDDGYVFELCE